MSVEGGQPQFLNVRETAKRLEVHENTVRNWVKQGILRTARVPGSRFHRFDARDVERLRTQRGASVSSVERERRTVGPELVDASQLHHWATTRDAQGQFPELVRRLLAATPGVTNVSVRAGDGVSAPSWDGRAETSGTSFLPAGPLVIEMGVGSYPKRKADEDFKKRRQSPEAKNTVFVFATPRRWADADSWATGRRAERAFRDVRVLHADDFEGWLQATPAVHYWISELLGRRPRHAESLERWWSRFQAQTDPPLPSALFLAGRDRERDQLSEFLSGPPGAVTIKAAWHAEAIAFVCATIEHMDETGGGLVQPPLVVSSAEVWDRIIAQPGRMTLLPLFESPDLKAAEEAGHRVVLPIGREQIAAGTKIELPRPHRQVAGDVLEAAGVDGERAYRLAALARRSMPSLVRLLSRDPRRARPPWSQLPHAGILAPLVLMGGWTSDEHDTAVIGQMVDKPWPEIERTLLYWQATDDLPFIQTNTQWHVAAAEEAFLVLRDSLTQADLARWRSLAVEILLETDPSLELSPDERPMAGVRGVRRNNSGVLRRGIAEGIALMSTGDERLSDGVSGPEQAHRVVSEILRRANADESGAIWRSLSDVLPLLAEASPTVFLDMVHDDLDRNQPLLASMFQDGDQSSWLYSASPHTGLLWALETLCWTSDTLLEASRALARLQLVDPGGRLMNRPLESLSSVFVGWVRQTAAPLETKVRALERICRHQPTVGWKLLMAVWPGHQTTASPPHAPRFHDWKPESRNVSISEWVSYIGHLVRLAVALAGSDPERWGELATCIGPLPPTERDRLLAALDAFADPNALDPNQRMLLWERVHAEIARHRRFPTADWSMDNDPLSRMQEIADRLEPSTSIARFGYLFDWHPDVPGIGVYDPTGGASAHAEYEERLHKLRVQAATEALRDPSLKDLHDLVRRSPVPHQLGSIVGMIATEEATPGLLEWLDAEDPKLRDVGTSWASRKLYDEGAPWLKSVLSRGDMANAERRAALAHCVPASRALWDALDETDATLSRIYWKSVNPWGVQSDDVDYAARRLLSHGRAWAAVDLLAGETHRRKEEQPSTMSASLVREVLDAALTSDPRESRSQALGYEIGQLIEFLEGENTPSNVLARYEFAFFRVLQHSRRSPRALFEALASDPALFVELVSLVYRGKNDKRRRPTEVDPARASHAWWVINHWRSLPGRREDGTVNGTHLKRWVSDARLAFADGDREDIGDEQIGHVLASSPTGSDDIWPAEPVREIIETIGSQSIISGMHIGVLNDRGVTSRGAYDGGAQERALARKYRDWAKLTSDEWPRTSRLLRGLADDYERDAQRQDARAELSADTE